MKHVIGQLLPGEQPWVGKFLNRPLKDYESYKKKSRKFYEDKFAEIGVTFHTKPFFHQLVCSYLALKEKQFMNLVDVGLGKSAISLYVIYGAKKMGLGHKALVLVPNLINIPSWKEEVKIHRPELKFVGLEGTYETRQELLKEDADIFCINYIGLQSLVTKLKPNPRKPGKRSRQIDDGAMAEFMKQFDIVIFDEISSVKNTRSTTFKICKYFKTHAKIRLGLTGTPFGRNLEDLWGEYFVVDGGEALGRNQYIFEKVFFDMQLNIWGGMDKTFRKKRMPELKRLMHHSAIRYEQKECFDLPPIIYKPIPLTMPSEMEIYYTKLKDKIREAITRNNMVMADIRTLWVQAREVISNFLQITDDNANKVVLDIPGPVKMEALTELCNELPEGHKMVIFHEFIESGNRIEKMITSELKEKCLRVKAGTEDREGLLDNFKNNPEYRFLVLSSHIGALGLNLQTANYVCFYESPVSPIVRRQAEARVYRTGQAHTTFIYDLYLAGSVEERIREFLKEGKNLFDNLMTNPKLAQL